MLPTKEQYLKCSATWKGEHNNISYSINHHGISDYQPQGIWCFYVYIPENIFINQDDFKLFDRPEIISDMFGKPWQTYDYYDVPDYGFHGGITWYSKEVVFDRNEGKNITVLKIGCDYNHLWDSESGYWQGKEDIERDVRSMIEKLVQNHPIKTRCKYSGIIDLPENFYESNAGWMIHNSMEDKQDHENWKRKAA